MDSLSDKFYEQLDGFNDFGQFTQLVWYTPLPADWFVVITDVQNSTKAIEERRYKDVNSLGVASIVALLNATKPHKIPYVFGGDGATICIPPSKKQEVASALVATKQMADKSFGLHLRIGMVPMKAILGAGHQVLIGKYQPSHHYQQAMFQGDGLGYAESLVKDPDPENPFLLSEVHVKSNGNFEGFECRWNEIPSPHEETITILVKALSKNDSDRDAIYSEVMENIFECYGKEEYYRPIRQEQMSLTSSFRKLSSEVRIRTAFQSFWKRWMYAVKLKLVVIAGKWMIHNEVKTEHADWGRYKQTLIANTDYRKFDELMRMVISGTRMQRERLRAVLETYREEGKIVFGIHTSPSALITCMISDHNMDHVHFIDGSNGGYALAAIELKRQLKNLKKRTA